MRPKKMTIDEIAALVHQNAVDHGWWEKPRSFGEICSLIHSEVSEAFEEHRNNTPVVYYVHGKPEGQIIELIDVVIRVLDYLASESVPIEKYLLIKHEYNKTRSYLHGGKKL